MECPECYADIGCLLKTGEPTRVRTDGQGFWHEETYEYICSNCGCEFTVTETTEITMEINKPGKKYGKKK